MVKAKDLKEYLRLPPDSLVVTGKAAVDPDIFADAVRESGTYRFEKDNGDWLLRGLVVVIGSYGIVPDQTETNITVEFETVCVDLFLSAARAKAAAAGVPEYVDNALYDMFILALAAMYYDNRGMAFQQPGVEKAAQSMINSFVLELRYGGGDG